MNRIIDILKTKFWSKDPQLSDEAIERLRIEFKARYEQFKRLLTANQKSLEIMADIEQALCSRPFGMTFVRSACTAVAVNVLHMIISTEQLAPGKYPKLRPRFEAINKAVQEILTPKNAANQGELILPLEAIDRSRIESAGGKMAGLGEIRNRLSIRVPEGFVITTRAYAHFLSAAGLQDEINRLFQATDSHDLAGLYSLSARIQQLIVGAALPDDLSAAILHAWDELEKRSPDQRHLRVAMRSSSLFEDSAGASFAGQFRTELNVSRDSVLTAYREVVASKYSAHAITYRLARGFRDEDIPIAVGCIVMVDAVAGGVAYSHNPVDGSDDAVHISSNWGLSKAIVDGSTAFDQFIVTKSYPTVRSVIGRKETLYTCLADEGLCRLEANDEKMDAPSLTTDQILKLSSLVMQLENYYRTPVDVEWSVDADGGMVILQCRPMQQTWDKPKTGDLQPPAVQPLLTGGVTASPGVTAGPIFIAVKSMDALTFPEGAILVVRQALPQWAGLISRAAGVIAEQGGVAGHLANVAREFRVPALFGCSGAMQQLLPEQMVTLDADHAKVYPGRMEELLTQGEVCANIMVGSPVYELLVQAGRHILPLTLLDPTAPDFHPSNCRTFHDLTRFMHEKSVHEMFNFGREHHFSERAGKQLFYKVPMKWWVLNLDDGFREEITGKYVRLEQITSIPMRAFWDGFAAIPWDGPPAVDGRGFASVLFQSTMNPALATGRKSSYADKNYFMISRNFCNLNSRFGYHFLVMEALVSARSAENYVSFQFKGGAADTARRLKRVRLIGEILETYDFHIDIRQDNLIARIQNFDCETMQKRIKILGHLSLHTRQLDMIMANPVQVQHFGSKIHKDIEFILSLPVETPAAMRPSLQH
jgi:pyruvate, water dikinase